MKEMIKVKHLYKYYGQKNNKICILDDVNFSIGEGEFVAVIGESGSGKTTLLNILGTLDYFDGGEVYIDGFLLKNDSDKNRAKFRAKNLGFVFQKYNLINGLTVFDNIVLPLEIEKRRVDKQEIYMLMEMLGVLEKREQLVDYLSGGECQRVAIARGLVHDPKVILADEPTGNLDSRNGDDVMRILTGLARERKKTIVMVTHNRSYATLADRCIRIRDGKICNL